MLKGNVKRDGISGEDSGSKKERIQIKALERFLEKMDSTASDEPQVEVAQEKMMARKKSIDVNDSIALERIMGENDLMPVSYLSSGFNVGKSVCKIVIRDKVGNNLGSGTGFLIAPGIVMTNNHVLTDPDMADNSIAKFNYQNDEKFMPCPEYNFKLEPHRFFITDEELDFTIVAVSSEEDNGKTVRDFGYIPLLADKDKVLEGEYVSIIQHPKGGPKSVTLRENQVKFIFDDFIHYITDTQPGSSGSPVFNDQWIVVGLHHSGVPNPDKKGEWIANEGIRISSIVKHIKEHYRKHNEESKIIKSIFPDISDSDIPDDTTKSEGYNASFLGKEYEIGLPKLSDEMKEDVTKMKNGNYVLDYVHFSIVMCRSRGLAYFTAVNIDGKQKVDIKRGGDKWRFDERISEEYQYGNDVYKSNDLDRGHLVKRNDPNWGEDAYDANDDTFHYTNSAPQHKNLNQKIWLGLEDYILKNANSRGLKISVFTGPVFKEDDDIYREKYKIPAEFWKVVIMVKDDGELSATAYLQSQENMLDDLEFVYGQYETYQVPVTTIEEKTGLDFGKLSEYDPMANVEFTALLIKDESSIRF